jgi:hypothetical protein
VKGRHEQRSRYELFKKIYEYEWSKYYLEKRIALKKVIDFEWQEIGKGLKDKGESWITEYVETKRGEIDKRWIIQKECEVRNEIAVIRSKQQRMAATKADEDNLIFFQGELAKVRNTMADIRENYKKKNPRTYGIVDVNDRNKRWMLRDERKEIVRYKAEDQREKALRAAGKEVELNPFMRVPMEPTQLWMTGSTAKEKLALRQAVVDKEKAEKEKKKATPAKKAEGAGTGLAGSQPPKKTAELELMDAKAESLITAYAYDGPVDMSALENEPEDVVARAPNKKAGSASAEADTVVQNGGPAAGKPEKVITMGEYLKYKRRKLAD